MNKIKTIEADQFENNFICKCGNTVSSDGFYPCNEKGEYIEPTPEWEGYYKCERCEQIYLPYF
jgi:hypothetical protein